MKKISIFLLTCFMAVSLSAQDNVITKYFSDFQQDENFTKVNVSSKMFSLFTEIDGEDEAEKAVLEAMSKLKGVKALVSDTESDGPRLYKEALKRITKDGSYEELMSVEDGEENVMFMIRSQGDTIAELILILKGGNDFMLMSLFGEIDLNQIAKISKVLKISGMEEFGQLAN
ncbi:MAG: DUF4252 domain-containing protein [Saprospiraceae bacterium]|nr:DUF4252 domain-containing protein [Saprospiraceae bacterium]